MGNGRETCPKHLPEVRPAAIAVMSAHPTMVSAHLCRPSLKQLEVNDALFKTFAFNTHVPAYLDGGLADLPERDLLLIGGQPNIEEWADKETWLQAIDSGLVVGEQKIKTYAKGASDTVENALKKLMSWLR